jgi:Cytochrome c3/Doubled CXXCH motif (Paired_CXXCH_1)
MVHRRKLFLGAFLIIMTIFLVGVAGTLASPQAQSDTSQPTPTPDPRLSISDEVCLGCHGQPGPSMVLENGDVLDLYVPQQDYKTSVHGSMGYACVQCHRQIGNYPHAPFKAKDLRDVSLQLYQACKGCHQEQYALAQDSVHATAMSQGMREAAICTDCHSAHSVRRLNKPGTLEMLPDARVWVPLTCSKCHNAIFVKYKESVHGSALIGEGNPDVPTCIDCHGVHNIENPTTAAFRLRSPEICAKCHTDEAKMAKYGISTQVLNTYVADFHGTTVTLFEKMTPDAETNKPVCYDCHGIHDIQRVDDPTKGLEVRENLLKRCQRCHPGATANFSSAWMSHYIPSPEKNPIVYYVNLFYKFFIPSVLGAMAVLVALDINKTAGERIRRLFPKAVPVEGAMEPTPDVTAQPGVPEGADLVTDQPGEEPKQPEQEQDMESHQADEISADEEEDSGISTPPTTPPDDTNTNRDQEVNHD